MPVHLDREILKQAIREQVLPALATGLSMNQVLDRMPQPFPTRWAVMKAINADADLREQFRQAVDERADVLAEAIVAVAHEPVPSGLSAPEAAAWTARQRLKFDALRWTASKLAPGRWSESVQVSVNVSQAISITAALESAQRRLDAIEVEPQPAALLADSRLRA